MTRPKPMQCSALSPGAALLSVVVPVCNEQEVLPEFHRRLSAVLEQVSAATEIVFANDGSTDATGKLLEALHDRGPSSSRRLEPQLRQGDSPDPGLDHARGDAIVVIDADLQDPPELIPELVKHWREGYDAVYATRTAREGETALNKLTARLF